MAQIVAETNGVDVQLAQIRKEMWNHKPFSDIYTYNRVIGRVKELSKMPVTAMIEKIVTDWSQYDVNELANMTTPIERSMSVDYPYLQYPLSKVEEDDKSNPHFVMSSVIEIVDPMEWVLDGGSAEYVVNILEGYIQMGLYPTIGMPPAPQELSISMATYDALLPKNVIGTIVGLVHNDIGPTFRTFAIVMWEPDFTNSYSYQVWGSGAAVLMLRNGEVSPELWKDACKNVKDPKTGSEFPATFYIPIYELSPHRTELNRIIRSPSMNAMVNDLFVAGQVELDFVKFTTDKLNKTAQALVDVCTATGVRLDDDLKIIPETGVLAKTEEKPKPPFAPAPGSATGVSAPPDTPRPVAPKPEPRPPRSPEPDVPVEDAKDSWASFMRGLDEPPIEAKAPDIYSGMMENVLEGDDVFLG